uniref:Response regulatory domain-containing protein n=1 Tax=uncultured Nocardioidaceae bacterium TaxID=253824 RepID=A0A6J4MBC6_9ACTN|nr:MAG: hypothetical protein AVDCRST_MAG46-2882 [uncultured Nocardioidaceae bacterium]
MSGCAVTVVNSGRASLDLLQAEPVDLVVLDVSMPGMSGLDVLRVMGDERMLSRTPVVMFSASEESRQRALRLGAVAFVLKHEPDDLMAEIGRHLCCRGVPPEAHGHAYSAGVAPR